MKPTRNELRQQLIKLAKEMEDPVTDLNYRRRQRTKFTRICNQLAKLHYSYES